MVKTQIQIPDGLYRELKRLAEAKEWSLAETLRRAAEQFLSRYPHPTPSSSDWSPPVSDSVGWRGLTPRQIHDAGLADMGPRVESRRP